MKKFSILLAVSAAIFAASCSKQAPDWDQIDCQRVNFYTQRYTDSTLSIKIGEELLTWPQNNTSNLLCGSELAKDIKDLPRGVTLCDVDGTTYFNYYYFKIE